MTSPSFDPSTLASNVLAAFASPFSQANRIVQLAFAGGSGIAPDTLLAHRVAFIDNDIDRPIQQLANQGWRGFEHRSAIKAEHGAEGDDFRNLLAQGKNKDA